MSGGRLKEGDRKEESGRGGRNEVWREIKWLRSDKTMEEETKGNMKLKSILDCRKKNDDKRQMKKEVEWMKGV